MCICVLVVNRGGREEAVKCMPEQMVRESVLFIGTRFSNLYIAVDLGLRCVLDAPCMP
jgi:hypothetical protein